MSRRTTAATVILVNENGPLRDALASALRSRGITLVAAPTLQDTIAAFRSTKAAAVIINARTGGEDATIATVESVRAHDRRAAVILVAENGSEQFAVNALRAGVKDYHQAPPCFADLLTGILRCVADRDSPAAASPPDGSTPLIGESPAMVAIREYAERIAADDASVIITGETGTGKEVVAKLVHGCSARRAGPFVAVNCAAIPDTLIESELFGHERGAFTGAHAARDGHLRQAHGGTILFDEIGDMGPQAQAKILRALESRQVVRLGGRHAQAVDVRVLAATNRDLDAEMMHGRFRKDLYFRLNVARIHLPPLRERRDDIPALVNFYVAQSCRRHARRVPRLADEALRYLMAYEWPGNIRELKNVVDVVFLNRPGEIIHVDDLPGDVRQRAGTPPPIADERQRMIEALEAAHWNKSVAADRLRWSRMTLYRKLAKYNVSSPPEH